MARSTQQVQETTGSLAVQVAQPESELANGWDTNRSDQVGTVVSHPTPPWGPMSTSRSTYRTGGAKDPEAGWVWADCHTGAQLTAVLGQGQGCAGVRTMCPSYLLLHSIPSSAFSSYFPSTCTSGPLLYARHWRHGPGNLDRANGQGLRHWPAGCPLS